MCPACSGLCVSLQDAGRPSKVRTILGSRGRSGGKGGVSCCPVSFGGASKTTQVHLLKRWHLGVALTWTRRKQCSPHPCGLPAEEGPERRVLRAGGSGETQGDGLSAPGLLASTHRAGLELIPILLIRFQRHR